MAVRPTLLCIGGGVEATRGLARLRNLGVDLAVLDGNPNAPGFELATYPLVESTYDVVGAVAAAQRLNRETRVAGVMAVCADVPHTVAAVAKALGLPGMSTESADLAMDKLAMKRTFKVAGLPVPWFQGVRSVRELEDLVAGERSLIIKPVDSRGARGVIRLLPDVDLHWAFQSALSHSPSGRVMVEEYLGGRQLSTESMLWEGVAYTAGLSDRGYDDLEACAPFMIENGGDQPATSREELLPKVDQLIARIGRVLGMDRGVLKGDLVLDENDNPIVIEVAPRLSGGYFCTDQIPVSTGVDLVWAQAMVSLGRKLTPEDLQPKHWQSTCVRYFQPPAGRLLSVQGLETVRAHSWVHHATLFVEPGEELRAVHDHTARAGMVMTMGATRQEARARAAEAIRQVEFHVEPVLSRREEPAA